MLTGVCVETAVALKNFQLYSDIEHLLDGFVRASVQAIEERDPVTAGHSFRVAGYGEHFAMPLDQADIPGLRQLAFTKDQVREIRYAALLHDFGKVGVRNVAVVWQDNVSNAEAWKSLNTELATRAITPSAPSALMRMVRISRRKPSALPWSGRVSCSSSPIRSILPCS